jgi:hypothetical protein
MVIADVTIALFPLTFLVRITSHTREELSESNFPWRPVPLDQMLTTVSVSGNSK